MINIGFPSYKSLGKVGYNHDSCLVEVPFVCIMRFFVVNALLAGLGEAIRSQYVPGAYLVEFQDNSVCSNFATHIHSNSLYRTLKLSPRASGSTSSG